MWRSMDIAELREYFRMRFEEAINNGLDSVDLLFCAVEIGETDLNKISFAARMLSYELGDAARLEAMMYGLVLWRGRSTSDSGI